MLATSWLLAEAMVEHEFDARCDYEIECITSGQFLKAVFKVDKRTMDSGQQHVPQCKLDS